MHVHTPPYYKALGVAPTASAEDIAKAFRKMSLQLHPDRNYGVEPTELSDAFQQIGEAYRILSDVEGRKRYDSQHGVNFQSRINDMRRVVGGGGASVVNGNDNFDDERDVRKRQRGSDEGEADAVPGGNDDDDDDDDEYDPVLHAPAHDVVGGAASSVLHHRLVADDGVGHAQLGEGGEVQDSEGSSVGWCDRQQHDRPIDAVAHRSIASEKPVSIIWSLAPHSAPQRVTFALRRAAVHVKWGLNCELRKENNAITSRLVLLPPTTSSDDRSCGASPCGRLPSSSDDGASDVVIDAVDGVSVRSIQDVVRCVANKLHLNLTLVVPNAVSFRLTMTSCCASPMRWLDALLLSGGEYPTNATSATTPAAPRPSSSAAGWPCCTPVQLLHCFYDTDPSTMRLHRRSEKTTTEMLLFALFGTEVPSRALPLLHPTSSDEARDSSAAVPAVRLPPWQHAFVPANVHALLNGKRLLSCRLLGDATTPSAAAMAARHVASQSHGWVPIVQSGVLHSMDDVAAFSADAASAFSLYIGTMGQDAALDLDVCD